MNEVVLDKQFIFIIGSPRSGTTWLQIMIGAHPSVCTSMELTMFELYIAPWIKAWNDEAVNIEEGRWHRGLPAIWSEDEFYGFLKEFLERTYGQVVATNPQATHILDKNPVNAPHTGLIKKFIPNARFIHIIRDGRDVAASMLAARKQIGFGPTSIQDAAMAWKNNIQSARDAKLEPDQYMEVRYEDILVDGKAVLESVFDFCGLPVDSGDIVAIVDSHQFEKMKKSKIVAVKNIEAPNGHYRKGKAGSWQEDLDPMQKYYFNKIAGDLLIELGYTHREWWASSRIQKALLPIRAKGSSVLSRFSQAIKILTEPITGRISLFRWKT